MVTRYVIVCSDGVVRLVRSCDDGCRELDLHDTREAAQATADAYTTLVKNHRASYPEVAAEWLADGRYCCPGPHTVAVLLFDAERVE